MPPCAAPSRRPAASRAVLCCALVTLLGGCSTIGAVRRPIPDRTADAAPVDGPSAAPTAGAWVVQRRPEAVDVRVVTAPVPAGFVLDTVEFADATHGAAVFTRCGTDNPAAGTRDACTAALIVTTDGGQSWQKRPHPQPVAAGHQLRMGSDRTLLLAAAPNAWYASKDLGRGFQRFPFTPGPPPAYQEVLNGAFQVCCGDYQNKIVRYADGRAQAVPAAPPLPGQLVATTLYAERDLWAASVDRGMAYTAFSADSGRTWQRRDVPGSQGGLVGLQLIGSADSADLWLLGARDDARRFPAVWRLGPDGWRLMPADGHPEAFRNAVPVGAGLLAATGALGTGLAGERWTATDWPSGGALRLLADGALEVYDERDGTVWLGVGRGVDRRWAQLVFRPSEAGPAR